MISARDKKSMKKIIRACTVSMSLGFVKGMLPDLKKIYEVVLLSSPGEEMEEIEKQGLARCIALPMERRISPIKDFISLCKLIKVFKREKPDMVHSMTPKAGLLCMMAGRLTHVPVRIHTFTGLVWPTAKGLQRWILKMTDRITCSCATHIIPEGQGVLNDLKTGGITSKELKVLGYGNVRGIDMTRFSHRPEIIEKAKQIRKNDVFTFLFVGRIVGDKGINELVEAFQMLNEEIPMTRLVLVGNNEDDLDPISDKTKAIIHSNSHIEAIGPKSDDNLIAYYAASDSFVFPSYREGFPNTVMEAGAMGLPCIVTDINGSREIITGASLQLPSVGGEHEVTNVPISVKQNGIIIPSKDVEALYEAMKRMIKDDKMRESLVANARSMIEERFEQEFVRKCLYEFYEEIL